MLATVCVLRFIPYKLVRSGSLDTAFLLIPDSTTLRVGSDASFGYHSETFRSSQSFQLIC